MGEKALAILKLCNMTWDKFVPPPKKIGLTCKFIKIEFDF